MTGEGFDFQQMPAFLELAGGSIAHGIDLRHFVSARFGNVAQIDGNNAVFAELGSGLLKILFLGGHDRPAGGFKPPRQGFVQGVEADESQVFQVAGDFRQEAVFGHEQPPEHLAQEFLTGQRELRAEMVHFLGHVCCKRARES